MSEQDKRHEGGQPDVPADPQQAAQPVLRRPFDPDVPADGGTNVHDMGGNVGAAPMPGAGDRSDLSAGRTGAAAADAGPIAPPEPDTLIAASPLDLDDPFQADPGGDASPEPAPTADEYVDIDPPGAGEGGRGADGDTAARIAQKHAEAGASGREIDFDAVRAAVPPGQADAEQMEAALRIGGPLRPVRGSEAAGPPPAAEDGPGTSLA